MRLVKGITGKTLHLPPYLAASLLVIAFGLTVGKEFILDFDQVVFAPVFARHHPPEHIGIGHIEPAIGIGDLHHIFLINHHAVGLFELLLKYGVWIDDRRGVVMPTDVLAHHARTGHAGPNDG